MSRRDWARHQATEAAQSAAGATQLLLEFLLAPLPGRWRAGLEDRFSLHVDRVAFASSLTQWALGFAGWAFGMQAWMHGLVDPLQGPLDSETDMYSFALLWMNPTLPLVYSFISPVGFLTMIGTAGGMIRLLYCAAHRQNVPDPSLYLVDRAIAAWSGRGAARSRERAKGAPSPDRVRHGEPGEPFDLRIVSCADYPWPVGSTVRILGEMHQLLEARELRDEQGRLRIAYTFKLIEGAGVVRGLQVYAPAQPPLVKERRSEG